MMKTIQVINRPNAYEVHVYVDGEKVDSRVCVFRQSIGRYSPPIESAERLFREHKSTCDRFC